MDIQGITKILMSCCYMQVVVTKYTKSGAKSFLKRNDTCCLKTTQSIPFQKDKKYGQPSKLIRFKLPQKKDNKADIRAFMTKD